MTHASAQNSELAAENVARSSGPTRSMANAPKIGLPAFISELRTAIAIATVQKIGEKPSTTMNGMLAAWTITTDPIFPTAWQAQAGSTSRRGFRAR